MSTTVTALHQLALDKAKVALMSKKNSVFFATLCFSIKQIWDSEDNPTAYTNGEVIGINPEFFMSLSTGARVSLLLHESLHVAYEHVVPSRMGHRNHNKWNRAGDYVINLQLNKCGFEIPAGWLLNDKFDGMSTEQVYDLLPDMLGDDAPTDIGRDIRKSTKAPDKLQADIQAMISRAATLSNVANEPSDTIPGDLVLLLDKLLFPKLPWETLLRRYMNATNNTDYTFSKPNKRYLPKFYMPTLVSEGLMDITIAIDTSGSAVEFFPRFVTEIHAILRRLKPSKITLIQFDTKIKAVDVVKTANELLRTEFTGNGGTCVVELEKWATDNRPKLLIVFTDGEFNFKGTGTKANTLWMINNNSKFKPPYGKVIHYEP